MHLPFRLRSVARGITLLVLLGIAFSATGSTPLRAQGGDPPESFLANDAWTLADAKGDNPKLDSALADLTSGGGSELQAASDVVVVEINVVSGSADAVKAAVAAAGGEVTITDDAGTGLQARLPVASLEAVATNADVIRVQQATRLYADPDPVVDPTLSNSLDAGLRTTEALRVSGAKAWQSAGFTGQGVKIGVVDLDFYGAPDQVLTNDLPGTTYYKDCVDPSISVTPRRSGTAAAEVIHDMAPDASLYLARVYTMYDLVCAITWFDDNDVKIVSSSITTFATGPGDGEVRLGNNADRWWLANLFALTRQLGILWVNTSGFTRISTWSGKNATWNGLYWDTGNGWVKFSNRFHEVNVLQERLPSGVEIRFDARWSDWTNVDQDLDLYVVRRESLFDEWDVIGSSKDYQTGLPGQTPNEFIKTTTFGRSAYYGVAIYNYSVNRLVDLQLFSTYPLAHSTPQRSLGEWGVSRDVLSVAAVDARYYTHLNQSSEGPPNGLGGTTATPNPNYNKPDIAGYANVSTRSYGTSNYGLSAAPSHVAGAAALVADAYNTTNPNTIQGILENRAIPRGAPGIDPVFGAGMLSLGRPPIETVDFDFDGDGKSDVLWLNRSVGEAALMLTSGSVIRPVLPTPAPGEVAAGVGDFTGDGRADVIWFNPITRRVRICNLATQEVTSEGSLLSGWHVAGVGDLNGDGVDDIVFRNQARETNVLSLMNYGVPGQPMELAPLNPKWRMAGVGDLNGDGMDDLLWEDTAVNDYLVDLMDGNRLLSRQYISRPFGTGWTVGGVADYTGDGIDDILWHNTSLNTRWSGWVRLSTMRNGQASRTDTVANAFPTWRIAAVNDYNGDGKADIIWRNLVTGDVATWLMNGITAIPPVPTIYSTVNLRWDLVGAVRLDGIPLQSTVAQGGDPGDPPTGSPPDVVNPTPGEPPTETQPPNPGDPADQATPIDDLTLPRPVDEEAATAQLAAAIGYWNDQIYIYLPLIIH